MTTSSLIQDIVALEPIFKIALLIAGLFLARKGNQVMMGNDASTARNDLQKQADSVVATLHNNVVQELRAAGQISPEDGERIRAAGVDLIRKVMPKQVALLEARGVPVSAMLEQFIEKAVVDLKTKLVARLAAPTEQMSSASVTTVKVSTATSSGPTAEPTVIVTTTSEAPPALPTPPDESA